MRFLCARREINAVSGFVSDIGRYEREDGRTFDVHLTTASDSDWPIASNGGDAWFILGFCFAAATREPLRHPDPVDRQLVRNLRSLSAQWAQWMPSRKQVHFEDVEEIEKPFSDSEIVASFYSGGVDSLHTAIAHNPRVNALITIGHEQFDANKIKYRLDKLKDISDYAIKSQRRHLCLITNVMTVLPEMLDLWAYVYHGPVYLALASYFDGISHAVLSSTHSYGDLMPWGSHPLTDALVSSRRLQAVHFGATYTRVEKTGMVGNDDVALSSLNVCSAGRVEPYGNCSHCQKCLRTMGTLDLLGIDKALATTFDWTEYSPAKLGDIFLRSNNEASFYKEMIAAADLNGRDDIASACRNAVRRSRFFSVLSSAELTLRMRYPSVVEHRSSLLNIRRLVYKALGLRQAA